MKIYERDIQTHLMKWLKKNGAQEVEDEIGLLGGIADIIYIDEKRKLCCIEVKLKDWKEVIEQARHRLNWAELVYIAMPIPKTYYLRKKIETFAKEHGLGVMWLIDNHLWQVAETPQESKWFKEHSEKWGYFGRTVEQSLYTKVLVTFMARCIDYSIKRKK